MKFPNPYTRFIYRNLFFGLLLFSTFLHAQKRTITLDTQIIDNLDTEKKQKVFQTSTEIKEHLTSLSNKLNKDGYLEHQIKLEKINDTLYNAKIHLNKLSEIILLEFKEGVILPNAIKNNTLVIKFNDLDKTIKNLYNFYENEGHSFTEIKLQNISSRNDTLIGNVHIETSKLRHIDKVVVKGYKSFPKKFIENYLDINTKSIFSKKTVETTSNSLQSLNFISQSRKPEVLFTKDSTHLYLYIQKKNSNMFDGLIGFTNGTEGKLQFNGYLNIQLNNNLNYGEQFEFAWSNNGIDQEHFLLKLKTPYLFNSRFTPEVGFRIHKQDSTFLTTNFNLNIDYAINKNNQLGTQYFSESSNNLLNQPNSYIESYDKKLLGLFYNFKLLYKSHTTISINTAANSGYKNTESQKSTQYYLYLDLILTEALSRKTRLYLRNKTESLKDNNLLQNELFRIGGANSIRGFYEQSIISSSYNYTNLEFRLLTAQESYIYSFSDFGLIEEVSTTERLYSFGLGYAYKTKGGFINLNYAFGKTNSTPFNFNQGIFHIKLTTVF